MTPEQAQTQRMSALVKANRKRSEAARALAELRATGDIRKALADPATDCVSVARLLRSCPLRKPMASTSLPGVELGQERRRILARHGFSHSRKVGNLTERQKEELALDYETHTYWGRRLTASRDYDTVSQTA